MISQFQEHANVLADLRERGTIELDGDVVYEDGTFSWESEAAN